MRIKEEGNGFTIDFSRNLSLLKDEDKFIRRKALKQLILDYDKQNLSSNLDKITFLKEVSSILNDSNEMNRSLSIDLLLPFINKNQLDEDSLILIVPRLFKSFTSETLYESSEELRFSMLNIVETLIDTSPKSLTFVEEIIKILSQSLLDKFHEMKKKAFHLITKIVNNNPQEFKLALSSLTNPLLKNIVHQHSVVRYECINCLKNFILHSDSKNINDLFIPLTQRLFDDSPKVRKCVIECVGTWLLDFIDRYSFHHQILPIFLSGLHDDFDEVTEFTEALWVEIGVKFEMENEEKLKDKIDFDQSPENYPLNKSRPNFGCRELISQSAYRIIPSLINDISDWLFTNRQKAAFLLAEIILHLEDYSIQYAKILIDGIVKGLTDSLILIRDQFDVYKFFIQNDFVEFFDPKNENIYKDFVKTLNNKAQEGIQVFYELIRAAYYFGHLVDIKNWWPIVKVSLDQCHESTSTNCLSANLWLLNVLLKATRPPSLSNGKWSSIIKEITQVLTHDDMISLTSYQNKVPIFESACSLGLLYSKTRSTDLYDETIKNFISMSLFTIYIGVCSTIFTRVSHILDASSVEKNLTSKDSLDNLINSQAKEKMFTVIATLDEKTCNQDEINRQFSKYLPDILDRIERSVKATSFWHCNSLGLHMIGFVLTNCSAKSIVENLERSLRILIRGCRLEPYDGNLSSSCFKPTSEGDQTNFNPVSLANEAELRLKGLKIFIGMTEIPLVRNCMGNLKMLNDLLRNAIFPTCIWRAGRVAESMRLLATTSLLTLIGANCEQLESKDDYLLNELTLVDGEKIENWLLNNFSDAQIILKKIIKIPRLDYIKNSSEICSGDSYTQECLINLPLVTLKQLFKTISTLIEDDLELTRCTALRAMGLLFSSFLSEGVSLLKNPNWFMNPTIELSKDYANNPHDQVFPQSLGDDIMRFYPNILKRLDDIKEPVRQLASDCLIYWMMLIRLHTTKDGHDILTCSDVNSVIPCRSISSTYQPIFQDFLERVSLYLDDQEPTQRLVVARIILYAMHRIHPDGCEKVLKSCVDKFRCHDLVIKMLDELRIQ